MGDERCERRLAGGVHRRRSVDRRHWPGRRHHLVQRCGHRAVRRC
jgi:hypothetical protein